MKDFILKAVGVTISVIIVALFLIFLFPLLVLAVAYVGFWLVVVFVLLIVLGTFLFCLEQIVKYRRSKGKF